MEDDQEYNNELITKKHKLQEEVTDLKKSVDTLEQKLAKIQREKSATEHKVEMLSARLAAVDETIEKLQNEKLEIQDSEQQMKIDLQSEASKVGKLLKKNYYFSFIICSFFFPFLLSPCVFPFYICYVLIFEVYF